MYKRMERNVANKHAEYFAASFIHAILDKTFVEFSFFSTISFYHK